MGQFIEGVDRHQAMLLPESLDDYVGEDSAVRVIDAFVEMLDLAGLGFNAAPAAMGRLGYHPGLMLRIYLYGYLNQVQSSRRLERECGRNLELIWLTGRLKPDFKTIADFRKDNGPAIRMVCQQFVALCRDIHLLDGNLVAIDGSRFKAVNSKAKNYTRGKLRQKLGEIDKAIERYLGELDRADEVFEQTGTVLPEARMERTLRKLEHLRKEAARYRSIEKRMDETGETQVSLSDPDARSMATTPRMPRVVGYNVQTAVEAENHLIVAHEVTMHGYDRDALSMMTAASLARLTASETGPDADAADFSANARFALATLPALTMRPEGFTVAKEYVDVETAKQTGRGAFGEMVTWLRAHPGVLELAQNAQALFERQAVYKTIFDRAATILSAGHSVLLDATFVDPSIRARAEMIAAQANVPFQGFWLHAPKKTLEKRVRFRKGDASDADIAVLELQMASELGALNWHKLDASGDPQAVRAAAREICPRWLHPYV